MRGKGIRSGRNVRVLMISLGPLLNQPSLTLSLERSRGSNPARRDPVDCESEQTCYHEQCPDSRRQRACSFSRKG